MQALICGAGLQSVRRLQGILCCPTSHSSRSHNDPMMPNPPGLEGNKAWDSKHATRATPPNISKKGAIRHGNPSHNGAECRRVGGAVIMA